MIATLLFDLDGTLLPLDQDLFLSGYLKEITKHFVHLIEPQKLVRQIMASTEVMIKNLDPEKTNQEVFMEDFLPKLGYNKEDLWPIFDKFYEEEFPALVRYTKPTPLSKRIIETAKQKGLEVVVATNPLFPANAIEHRLNWVGLKGEEFKLVTTYETSHFCKPQLQYYQEILEKIKRNPEECLMFGNDTTEDLVARSLGIKTYLVKDCMIDMTGGKYQADYEGKLEDVLDFIQEEKWM
jgi:FMN phosphatase YigB (HAD superfamily)